MSRTLKCVLMSLALIGLYHAFSVVGLEAGAAGKSPDAENRSFSVYKKTTLAELGQFEFDRREHILETIDELSRQLWALPDRIILKSSKTETIPDSPVLDLVDIDGDGAPDFYAYGAKSGSRDTQHFGFVFDLNEDGKIDYFLFNQGTMIAKPIKIISTFYHLIDSDYDGDIDIWVNPDTDLDQDGMVDEGVFSWLYDVDNDGAIDSGDYLGRGVYRAMECKDDVIGMKCITAHEVNVGETGRLEFATKMLTDMNTILD